MNPPVKNIGTDYVGKIKKLKFCHRHFHGKRLLERSHDPNRNYGFGWFIQETFYLFFLSSGMIYLAEQDFDHQANDVYVKAIPSQSCNNILPSFFPIKMLYSKLYRGKLIYAHSAAADMRIWPKRF